MALGSGVVPEDWRSAMIVPLYKSVLFAFHYTYGCSDERSEIGDGKDRSEISGRGKRVEIMTRDYEMTNGKKVTGTIRSLVNVCILSVRGCCVRHYLCLFFCMGIRQ